MEPDLGALIADRFGSETRVTEIAPTARLAASELARILARRTPRRYTDAPVPDGLIDLLLAVALSSSSAIPSVSAMPRSMAGRRTRRARRRSRKVPPSPNT
jgi:hypothetical protein